MTPRYAPMKREWSYDWTPYCKLEAAAADVLAVYQTEIRAIDAASGTKRWEWRAPTVISEHTVTARAVFAVVDRSLYAVSLATGEVEQVLAVPNARQYGSLNPVVLGERMLWATPSSDASGPLLWSAPIDSLRTCASRPLPADMTVSGLFAAKDRLVVKRHRDRYECISVLDVDTCEVSWDFGGSFNEGKSPSVLEVFDEVVVARQGKEIVALALATGVELWRGEGVGVSVFVKAGPRHLVRVSRPRSRAATNVVTIDVAQGTETEAASYRLFNDKKVAPGDASALVHDGVLWLRNAGEFLVGIVSNGAEVIELSGDTFGERDYLALVATNGYVVTSGGSGVIGYRYAREA